MTLYPGAHLSAAAGYSAMVEEAAATGANTFSLFTRNPRGGRVKPVDEFEGYRAGIALLRSFS